MFLSICWKQFSASLMVDHNGWPPVTIAQHSTDEFKKSKSSMLSTFLETSRKSQTELLTSVEVLRIKPVSFYSSLPKQASLTLVYFTLYCYLIPPHTWVSLRQWNSQVIESRLFSLLSRCPLTYQAHPQHIPGSKVRALLNQGLACWSFFVNNVLLDTAVSSHLSGVCGCFHATTTE